MPRVSVIIPTHNRPGLLREALSSVQGQTYADWEVIVVDDGSDPPVDLDALQHEIGSRLIGLHNDQPRRQAYARDQGVQVATGDVITHLDDDDLLDPRALECGLAALESDPELELVYLGVKGFGQNSIYFDENQFGALRTVLAKAGHSANKARLVRFDSRLFPALLHSVPMAFQRSIEYRRTWDKVSSLRRRVYMRHPDVNDHEEAMDRLKPPLRESEWALYAAACCETGLLQEPLYLQRCEGQGYFSQATEREGAGLSNIDIKSQIADSLGEVEVFSPWQHEIRNSLALAYFDQAYFYFQERHRGSALGALFRAIKVRPKLSYLRFALRILLPFGAGRAGARPPG